MARIPQILTASLSWNPFIHFLHTIHIRTPPDIVTRWHILCFIYFSCTIQVLIKQEQISPHSWCHYTNFQKGAAPLCSPMQRDHQAVSLARGPGTLLPIFGFLDAFRVNDYLLQPRQHSIDHMTYSAPVVCTHPESWQMEHYYILYFKSPSYTKYLINASIGTKGIIHLTVKGGQLWILIGVPEAFLSRCIALTPGDKFCCLRRKAH